MWLANHDTSPLTREKLRKKEVKANTFARKAIRAFLEANPSVDEDEIYVSEVVLKKVVKLLGSEDEEVFKKALGNRLSLLLKIVPSPRADRAPRTLLEHACDQSSAVVFKWIVGQVSVRDLDQMLSKTKTVMHVAGDTYTYVADPSDCVRVCVCVCACVRDWPTD